MAEKQTMCCLRRVGGKTTEKALISLEGRSEVTMGRGLDCTVRLGSSVMLSRKHAVLKKVDGVWSITDKKSLNGVSVNSEKITAEVPVTLKEGDMVQLGVPDTPGVPAEFVWRFHLALKVKKMKPKAPATTSNSEAQKRSRSENISPSSPNKHPALKRLCINTSEEISPTAEYKKKLEQIQRESEEKIREQQRLLEEMKRQLEEKEKAQEEVNEKLREKEEQLKKEVEQKQAQHDAEREKIKRELREKYERELKEKEESLLEKLSEERSKLEETREDLELQLSEQMAKEIHERDLKLQKELMDQKTRLNAIIQEKDAKQKLLECQLTESKDAQLKAKEENALEVKEDLLKNFADLMEMELQCSICSELFVQATSLNCSHSFCAYCISQWMDVKKECPVCRARITSHLRAIVLDSYIDRMIEFFTDEMKEARKAVIESRKAEEAKREADKKAEAEAKAAASTSHTGRGRRRGRARGRSGTSRGRTRAADARETSPAGRTTRSSVIDLTTPPRPALGRAAGTTVISSSSNSSDSDNSENEEDSDDSLVVDDDLLSRGGRDSDDSDSSQEGYGYFGGYGRCYNCGRRGHWAHGCPN